MARAPFGQAIPKGLPLPLARSIPYSNAVPGSLALCLPIRFNQQKIPWLSRKRQLFRLRLDTD